MRMEQVEQFAVHGLTTRTNNHDEMKTSGLKIGALWQDFYVNVAPNLQTESEVFGIYHQYESDHLGEFDVTAGATHLQVQSKLSDQSTLGPLSWRRHPWRLTCSGHAHAASSSDVCTHLAAGASHS